MKTTKGFGQLSSDDTFFSDTWFSGIQTVEEANTHGVYYCGPVKNIHKGILLATL